MTESKHLTQASRGNEGDDAVSIPVPLCLASEKRNCFEGRRWAGVVIYTAKSLPRKSRESDQPPVICSCLFCTRFIDHSHLQSRPQQLSNSVLSIPKSYSRRLGAECVRLAFGLRPQALHWAEKLTLPSV
jgi:hypothetical protein